MTITALCLEASRQAKLTQREEDLLDVTQDYTEALAELFNAQGALFVAGLEPFRGRFAESLREADPPSPLDGVWINVWQNVENQTEAAMTEETVAAASVAMATGGESAVAAIGLNLTWDLTNPRVIAFLERAGELITRVNDETRSRIGTIIRNGAKNHLSYDELARQIVDAFSFMGQGATQMHIDSRAHLIAVTELGNAYEEASMIVARDLESAGFPMLKKWNNRGDSRVSDGCIQNGDAGPIPLTNEWPASGGTYDRQRPLRFPGCRCWMTTEIDPKHRQAARDRFGIA